MEGVPLKILGRATLKDLVMAAIKSDNILEHELVHFLFPTSLLFSLPMQPMQFD